MERAHRPPAILVAILLFTSAAPAPAGQCQDPLPTAAGPAVFVRSYRPFLASPTRLALDADDNVYIADPLNGRIVVRAPDGRVLQDIGGLGYPISIAVDGSGAIYVGEGNRGRVDVFDASGQPLAELGQGDGEFSLPEFLAINQDDDGVHVYVVDGNADSVKRYHGVTGAFELGFGGSGTGNGQFLFPSGIDVVDGEVFVVDRGNSRVQVFDPDGGFVRAIALPQDNCGFLCGFEGSTRGRPHDTGIRVGAEGAMYLAEGSKGRVLVLSAAGASIGAVGDFGATPGLLRGPTDMVIDSCGRLFVANSVNARVDIFGLPDYIDAEQYAPGRLAVANQPIDPGSDTQLVAYLELPGYAPGEISDVVANGSAVPLSRVAGDGDGDTIADVTLVFGADLLASLGAGPEATVTVTGAAGALRFEESAAVQIAYAQDADDDGVTDDVDRCPETPARQAVRLDGCTVGQLCRCGGPGPGGWDSHDTYVRCVDNETQVLVDVNVLDAVAREGMLAAAAATTCGVPAEPPPEPSPGPGNGGGGSGSTAGNPSDRDRDGVRNARDVCPRTAARSAVDSRGCALVQRCPCAGPARGKRWVNRSAYLRCAANFSRTLVKRGALTATSRAVLRREVAGSSCGVPGG